MYVCLPLELLHAPAILHNNVYISIKLRIHLYHNAYLLFELLYPLRAFLSQGSAGSEGRLSSRKSTLKLRQPWA